MVFFISMIILLILKNIEISGRITEANQKTIQAVNELANERRDLVSCWKLLVKDIDTTRTIIK